MYFGIGCLDSYQISLNLIITIIASVWSLGSFASNSLVAQDRKPRGCIRAHRLLLISPWRNYNFICRKTFFTRMDSKCFCEKLKIINRGHSLYPKFEGRIIIVGELSRWRQWSKRPIYTGIPRDSDFPYFTMDEKLRRDLRVMDGFYLLENDKNEPVMYNDFGFIKIF